MCVCDLGAQGCIVLLEIGLAGKTVCTVEHQVDGIMVAHRMSVMYPLR